MLPIVAHRALRAALAAALLALPWAALPAPAQTVAVAVAANMKPAFEEIAARFREENPGVEVQATFGASGNFFAQVANGAPFDLFLSADAEFPEKMAEKGLTEGKPFTYAYGKLVVWTPNGSPIDLEHKGLAALADPAVRKIAIANPELAPYGRAARTALEKAGVYAAVKDRIVMGQSASQAAQFVESGNAQAGFVPLSLARTPPLAKAGRAWPVPASSHDPIAQAAVILRGARDAALARELAAFLRGDAARAILDRYGYALPAR
jgi:molybdate transport system substrate-binding protein